MSSGQVDPINNPDAWDVVIVSGVTSPGLCVVRKGKLPYEWDVKKGKGTVGATTTFTSQPPIKFSAKFWLWEPDHFAAWDDFRDLLKYDPTKKDPQGIEIYHPAIADLDVHVVTTENIGQIEPVDEPPHGGTKLWTIEVDFLQFFPVPAKKIVGGGTPATVKYTDPASPGKSDENVTATAQTGTDALVKAAQET